MKIEIKRQELVTEIKEITIPAFRKRGDFHYAIYSEDNAICIFKSKYPTIGGYVSTGERNIAEAYENGTEESSYHEFIDILNMEVAKLLEIARTIKIEQQ